MTTPQQQKRARLEREYAKFSPAYLAEHPVCEARISSTCDGSAEMVHHRRLRSNSGALCLELNVLAVCGACHTYIHHNVAESVEEGFILTSGPEFDACKQPRKEFA
jgi:hypothetical protein